MVLNLRYGREVGKVRNLLSVLFNFKFVRKEASMLRAVLTLCLLKFNDIETDFGATTLLL